MTPENLASGNTLTEEIAGITAAQAKIAETDVTATLQFVKDGQIYLSGGTLSDLIGSSAYNTIVATAKTSLNTSLSSAKSTKQTALAAL